MEHLKRKNAFSVFSLERLDISRRSPPIFNGDILIVDRQVKVKNHDVIVGNLNGVFICKIIDTQLRLLLSANNKNQDIPITQYDQFTIEGVVIRSIRCHRQSHLLASTL